MAVKPIPETFNPIKTAYFAGIVDGEGYVGVMRTSYTRKDGLVREQPTIQVEMTHDETIRALWDHFGGCYFGRSKRVTKNHKLRYRWMVNWRSAKRVAVLLLPYSITKREALQEVINCVVHIRGPKGQLSDDQVRDIRKRRAKGATWNELGDLYQKHPAYIQQVGSRKLYKHVF